MSNFTTAERAALSKVLAGLNELLSLPVEPTRAPKASPADTVTAQILEPIAVIGRANGLLTAASGKEIRTLTGIAVNGNTKVEDAARALAKAKVPHTVTVADAATAMAEVRAAKATAPKAEPAKAPKAAKAAKTPKGEKLSPEQRKAVNATLAEKLRSKGVAPTGQAWAAAKAGERSGKVLRELNRVDGVTLKAAETPATPKAAVVAALSEDKLAKAERLVQGGFTREAALEIVAKLV